MTYKYLLLVPLILINLQSLMPEKTLIHVTYHYPNLHKFVLYQWLHARQLWETHQIIILVLLYNTWCYLFSYSFHIHKHLKPLIQPNHNRTNIQPISCQPSSPVFYLSEELIYPTLCKSDHKQGIAKSLLLSSASKTALITVEISRSSSSCTINPGAHLIQSADPYPWACCHN